MNFFRFLIKKAPRMMLCIGLAALLSGVCNAGLIALVNKVLGNPVWSTMTVAAFVALGLGRIITNFGSQYMLAKFSQEGIASLRRDLIRNILNVPLRLFEEIGSARLMVALTEDVLNITQGMLSVPVVAVNLAVLFGGAVYLGWLSWQVLLGMSVLIIVGACIYRLMVLKGFHYLTYGREEADKLFNHFRALTEGIKELKLHRARRREFLDENIHSATEAYQKMNVAAERSFILAQSWSHLLFFVLLAIVLFLLPTLKHIDTHALTGYIITILYLMGPLAGVMGSLSVFGRANTALQKIENLGMSLKNQSNEACMPSSTLHPKAFQTLELRNVIHSYHKENDDSHFTLGPIDLTFNAGELVFLVGGNGSGKSTLAKIITGLYPPEAGSIIVDGINITDLNRDDYRQYFSAVFSDFYVFNDMLGLRNPDLDEQAQRYLEEFNLNHRVSIRNGVLSTTSVSQGQRKRLALLTTYLEDRPFYVFDEWAADQDPHFKEVFYRELLPELKARGKTILVITHDDKFFDAADRLLKLDYGKLVHYSNVDTDIFETALNEG